MKMIDNKKVPVILANRWMNSAMSYAKASVMNTRGDWKPWVAS